MRLFESQIETDLSAEGTSNHMCLSHVQVSQQTVQIVTPGKRTRYWAGLPEATHVVSNHAEMFCQPLPTGIEHSAVQECGVCQYKRNSLARVS